MAGVWETTPYAGEAVKKTDKIDSELGANNCGADTDSNNLVHKTAIEDIKEQTTSAIDGMSESTRVEENIEEIVEIRGDSTDWGLEINQEGEATLPKDQDRTATSEHQTDNNDDGWGRGLRDDRHQQFEVFSKFPPETKGQQVENPEQAKIMDSKNKENQLKLKRKEKKRLNQTHVVVIGRRYIRRKWDVALKEAIVKKVEAEMRTTITVLFREPQPQLWLLESAGDHLDLGAVVFYMDNWSGAPRSTTHGI